VYKVSHEMSSAFQPIPERDEDLGYIDIPVTAFVRSVPAKKHHSSNYSSLG
jgi:hypothetical protein